MDTWGLLPPFVSTLFLRNVIHLRGPQEIKKKSPDPAFKGFTIPSQYQGTNTGKSQSRCRKLLLKRRHLSVRDGSRGQGCGFANWTARRESTSQRGLQSSQPKLRSGFVTCSPCCLGASLNRFFRCKMGILVLSPQSSWGD